MAYNQRAGRGRRTYAESGPVWAAPKPRTALEDKGVLWAAPEAAGQLCYIVLFSLGALAFLATLIWFVCHPAHRFSRGPVAGDPAQTLEAVSSE
jgi:hypothetical protein